MIIDLDWLKKFQISADDNHDALWSEIEALIEAGWAITGYSACYVPAFSMGVVEFVVLVYVPKR